MDVIVGGPPCQGFSTLGKQDAEDERNDMWRHYAHTIRRAQPKFFVVENVGTFLDSEQFSQFAAETNPSGSLSQYAVRETVLNAADFGAAQTRKRAVVIGHHRDIRFPGFPETTHQRDSWVALKEVLVGLPERIKDIGLPNRHTSFGGKVLPGEFATHELHLHRKYESKSLERFGHIPPGGNRFDIPMGSPAVLEGSQVGVRRRHGQTSLGPPVGNDPDRVLQAGEGPLPAPNRASGSYASRGSPDPGFPDDYRWVGLEGRHCTDNPTPCPSPSARRSLTHSWRGFRSHRTDGPP